MDPYPLDILMSPYVMHCFHEQKTKASFISLMADLFCRSDKPDTAVTFHSFSQFLKTVSVNIGKDDLMRIIFLHILRDPLIRGPGLIIPFHSVNYYAAFFSFHASPPFPLSQIT